MTTRDTSWPPGTPCWADIAVDDFDEGKEFYGRVLGWQVERGPEELGGYASCTKDGRNVAGLSPKMDSSQPTAWTTYLSTDDIEVTLQRVRDAGGQVVMEPMQVAEMGTMALAVDPGGAVVGFWQAGSHTGFERVDEPGSVTWSENFSRAWTQNQDFYRQVVGYAYDDMSTEDFEYATFEVDGAVAGGIGQIEEAMPAEMPPHWNVYFKVADVDATVAEVERLGGSVDRAPWDTPFGRIAALADNQGGHFMVLADPA